MGDSHTLSDRPPWSEGRPGGVRAPDWGGVGTRACT